MVFQGKDYDMPTDLKLFILAGQKSILQELVELVPKEKRDRAALLAEQIRDASEKIADLPRSGSDPNYTSCVEVIDAIELFLKDIDRPITKDEIIKGVLSKGFRSTNAKRTAGNIMKSLKNHLQGAASRSASGKDRLRGSLDGLIGLGGWPDSRFENL